MNTLVLQADSPTPDLPVGLYLFILFAALAFAAFILYRRWRSRRELETRLRELARLADLGRSILGAPLDLRGLAALIYQQAGHVVDTTHFQLGLFERDRYRLLVWVIDGFPQTPVEFRLTPGSLGIIGWLRDSQQTLLVRDFRNEREALPARPRYASTNPTRSAVFVPLLAGERTLGAMAIQSRTPNAFNEEDVRLLTIIANNAAAALENARLFEQARSRAAQLELLAEVSRQINVLQPLPAFYRQVVAQISRRFQEYTVSLFEAEAEVLKLVATTHAEWRDQTLVVPFGTGPMGEAARERRSVSVQELPDYDPELVTSQLPVSGAQAEIAVPLQIDERILGVLDVQSQQTSVDASMVTLFESLAAQIAFAILEAQLYSVEQRRAEQLAAIAQASRAVVSTLELDDMLDDVLDLMDDRFGYQRARIFLLHETRLLYHAATEAWAARWGHAQLSHDLAGPGLIAAVGRSLQPVLAADVTQHPDYLPEPGLADTRSEMVVPLVMAGRLLGVLDVQSEQVGAFTPDDVQTLQTLADTLAVAVRNARLFEAERRRRRLAETLREVSAALTSTLSLDGVLDLILSGLARVVNYDAASILLVNDVGELCLRAMRVTRPAEGSYAAEVVGVPLKVKMFARGETYPATLPFGEVDDQREYHDLLDLPEPHACLGAVLTLQGEHLGYLVVDRVGLAAFPVEEQELIAAFAAQASVAIENARLYTAQREHAWVSTALLQVAEAMAQSTELENALATVVRVTPMLVGVDWCAVLLAEDEQFDLRSYHNTHDDTPRLDLPGGLTRADWPKLAELLHTEEPVVVEPDDEVPAGLQPVFGGVMILLPLWVKGAVQGVLIVGQTPGETTFTAQRIQLIGGIANQASLALESALLDQAQQEEAWVNAALLQVAEAVASQPTLDESLETVVRLTPMLVGVERVVIYRYDRAGRAFQPGQYIGFRSVNGSGAAELAASAEELEIDPRTPTTLAALCRLPEHLAAVFETPLAMVWPLWTRGELLGALVVEHVPKLGRRQNILNGIAHQLSLAMENAELAREVAQQQRWEREMELGRDIQASFLPHACPTFPGWEICSFWRSARLVGGDFYDFIHLRSKDGVERWGIVVADVSDKGVPAALFMALSRTLLRSAAMNRTSPAATLTRLNELILSDARAEQFVTVFYGVWEPASGRFLYANAGHNPPVLVGANSQPHTLRAHGPALAVFDHVDYHEHELRFRPGEMLLIYSDGLTDAINSADEEFGLERVQAVLHAARHRSASEALGEIERAVEAHVGGVEAFDDMTMVVIKKTMDEGRRTTDDGRQTTPGA
jgi:GAF domain-containing protein